jgi:cell division protein FtsA
MLRKLTVIPIGSSNITRDISAEQINYSDAEQIKIFKGYGSAVDSNCPLTPEKINNIILGRMSEILKNVQYQIENSGYNIGRIIFTGGGSKLKNIQTIIEENLPNYRYRIANDVQMPYNNDDEYPIASGSITPALFQLLSKGNINCCEEEVIAPPDAIIPKELFTPSEVPIEDESPINDNPFVIVETETTTDEESPAESEKEEEEPTTVEDKKKRKDGKKPKSPIEKVRDLFGEWWSNEVTSDESSRDDRDNDELI